MLKGYSFLVTAGPTFEPIDPVRFIGNRSSGKMGFSIAEKLAENNALVSLVAGPVALSIIHPNIRKYDVETAEEMYQKCIELFPQCNGAILAAAVADFTPEIKATEKIKKKAREDIFELKLIKTKDIAAKLGISKTSSQVLAGFSLETNNELENAIKKLKNKNLDFIVLNSLRDEGAGFGGDTNKISIIDKNGNITDFQLKHKNEVAVDIVNYLINFIKPGAIKGLSK